MCKCIVYSKSCMIYEQILTVYETSLDDKVLFVTSKLCRYLFGVDLFFFSLTLSLSLSHNLVLFICSH